MDDLTSRYRAKPHNPRRGRRVLRTEFAAPFFDFLESLAIPGFSRTFYGKTSGRSNRFRPSTFAKDRHKQSRDWVSWI